MNLKNKPMGMKELLQEQLNEYKSKYSNIKAECIDLMKQKKPWQEKAKEAAGLKMMIDYTKNELLKY